MRIDQLTPVAQDLPINYPNGTEGYDEATKTFKRGWEDGTPTGITLRVLGRGSRAFREVQKQAYALKSKEPTADELEKLDAQLSASHIVGWTGLENADGPVPYSKEKALELMLMPELDYVREQVDAFVAERANFFRRGEKAVGGAGAPGGAAVHAEQAGRDEGAGA